MSVNNRYTFRVKLYDLVEIAGSSAPGSLDGILFSLNSIKIQIPGVDGYLKHGDTFSVPAEVAARLKLIYVNNGSLLESVAATPPIGPEVPRTDFTSDSTNGEIPLSVQFTDTSTGSPTSWLWDFGDDSFSTDQNPSHEYSEAGAYTVALTATNAVGSATRTKEAYITANSITLPPVADFVGLPLGGQVPLSVQFTDTSTESPTSWLWDFGDGATSTLRNPLHQYENEGTYSVTLTVSNVADDNALTRTNYIEVTAQPPAPVADFSAAPTGGQSPLTVTFTDASTGSPTSWLWNFGDGATSTSQNPSHEYADAGSYTVSLTATNGQGSDVETKTGYVTVITPVIVPVADFSGSPLGGEIPLTVVFTDASSNSPTVWLWNFGDGTTSASQNPSHEYDEAGVYTVALTATNTAGSNTKTRSMYITAEEPEPEVPPEDAPGTPTDFTATPADDTAIALTWDLADAADRSISIQRAADSGGSPGVWKDLITLGGGENIRRDGALYPSTPYWYRIRASNVTGNSSWSSAVSATTKVNGGTSGTPTDLTLTVNSAYQITLTVVSPTPDGSAPKLVIERSDDEGMNYQIVDMRTATTNATYTFIDTPLLPSTVYTYRVRQTTGSSYGPYCNAVSATTQNKVSGYPDVPTDFNAVTKSDTEVQLTWTDTNGGTASYKVYTQAVGSTQSYQAAVSGTWTLSATTSAGASSYTLGGLTASTARFIRVAASNGSGDSAATAPLLGLTSSPVGVTPQDYNIGPGKTYSSLGQFAGAVGFANLKPGDTVYVHPNEDESGVVIPYNEMFMLKVRGTPTAYIRIVGVPHPATGQLPIISGNQAVAVVDYSPSFSGVRNNLILIGNNATFNGGFRPGYLEINGLDLREASSNNAVNTYTDYLGVTRTYTAGSAGIYILCGDNLIIRGNEISYCDNTMFGEPNYENAGLQTLGEDWLIEGNYFHHAGSIGSDRHHSTYLGARRVTYQYNRYEAQRSGGLGSGLKDRGPGTVIRYNWFSGGARFTDLVEAQNGGFYALGDPAWVECKMYGNILDNRDSTDAANMVHWGGDSGAFASYRKGILRYYHNLHVIYRDKNASPGGVNRTDRVSVFDPTDGNAVIDARNNAFVYKEVTSGNTPPTANLFTITSAIAYFGKNWISPGWGYVHNGGFLGTAHGVENFVDSTGNNAGLVSIPEADFTPVEGVSALEGVGGRLPDGFTVGRQYVKHLSSQSRSTYGVDSDLGAFMALPDTTAPTVVSKTVNSNGNALTLTFSEPVAGHTGFDLDSDGAALSITYSSGDGTNSMVFNTSRVVLSGELLTLDYDPGDVEDLQGNALVTIAASSVTNNSTQVPDVTAPTFSGASIDVGGTSLTLTFSESVLGNNGFTIDPSGADATLTYSSGTGSTRVYTPSRTILAGETVTISYTPGNVTDVAGNNLAAFSNVSVTNNSLESSPDTPQYRSYAFTAVDVAANSITIAKPSGVAENDLLLLAIYSPATINSGVSGWTLIASQADLQSNGIFRVYWKKAGSSEPVDYTIGFSVSNLATGTITRFDGQSILAPINAFAASAPATSTTSTSPAVTTDADDCLILRFMGYSRALSDVSPPPGHIERYEADGTTSVSYTVTLATAGQSSAGNSGTADFTTSIARANAMITVALAPFVPDLVAPVVSSSSIGSNGTTLTVSLSEACNGHTGFSLGATLGSMTLTYVSGDGTSSRTYTTSRTVLNTETVTLNYSSGDVEDLGFPPNPLADISGASVTNNSSQVPDVTAPTVTASNIDAAGTSLTVTLSESCTGNNGFTISPSGGAATLTYSSGTGTSRVYTTSRTIAQGETVTLAYSQSSGNVVDASSNEIADFSGTSVTNNSTQDPVGVPVFQSYSWTGLESAATSITVSKPSGTVDGNLLLTAIHGPDSGTVTVPSGWTLITSQADVFSAGTLRIYYKVASSEPSDYTWSFSTSRLQSITVNRITGQNASPLGGTATKASPANSTTQTSPSITTTASNCLVLRFLGIDRPGFSVTAPAGHNKRYEQDTVLNTGLSLTLATTAKATSGATGTADFTLSASRPTALITVSIAPA